MAKRARRQSRRSQHTTPWELVGTIGTHEIKRHTSSGRVGCDCMAYRFAKKEAKTCKHLAFWAQRQNASDRARELSEAMGLRHDPPDGFTWRDQIKSENEKALAAHGFTDADLERFDDERNLASRPARRRIRIR